jgi:hypothetical protein
MDSKTMNFLNEQSGDARMEKILNDTSAEARAKTLSVSGTYVMECDTGWYYSSDKQIHIVPDIGMSSKQSVLLTIRLKVAVPTDVVGVGETLLTNMAIIPKKGASDEEIAKTFKLCKPRLAALLGTDKVNLTDKGWIIDNLTADIDTTGANPKIVRDHKMKSRVLVVVEDSINPHTGLGNLKVASISPATINDKSVSNKIKEAARSDGIGDKMKGQAGMTDSDLVTQSDVDQINKMSGITSTPPTDDLPTTSDDFPQ